MREREHSHSEIAKANHAGLGLKLSPSNGLRILNKDFTRFIQSSFFLVEQERLCWQVASTLTLLSEIGKDTSCWMSKLGVHLIDLFADTAVILISIVSKGIMGCSGGK